MDYLLFWGFPQNFWLTSVFECIRRVGLACVRNLPSISFSSHKGGRQLFVVLILHEIKWDKRALLFICLLNLLLKLGIFKLLYHVLLLFNDLLHLELKISWLLFTNKVINTVFFINIIHLFVILFALLAKDKVLRYRCFACPAEHWQIGPIALPGFAVDGYNHFK